ncbi:MAG: hypothetical protein IKG21_10320 [Atopobiaceae bacterium]|nr:hypothetical protein [Atopobiaceae bacterium]
MGYQMMNCTQLWEDIISIGRGTGAPYFTGSVVMVQQGTLVPAGTP